MVGRRIVAGCVVVAAVTVTSAVQLARRSPPSSHAAASEKIVAPQDASRATPPIVADKPTQPGFDPWAPIDAGPDTPERKRARAEAALARVPQIVKTLSGVRGLALLRDVDSGYQTNDEFRDFLRKDDDADASAARSADTSAAMFHLGLVADKVDIAEAAEHAFATQTAAYYSPKRGKFFLLHAPENQALLDVTMAHELTHALQDQHFGLEAFTAKAKPPNSDASLARRFVIEGDATYSMFMYQAAASGRSIESIEKWVKNEARGRIEYFAQMAPEDAMVELLGPSLDADHNASAAAAKTIPPIVMIPMFESYFIGAQLAMAAFDAGGWSAVDDLFRHPPDSTEQVLHPKRKLLGKREPPVRVTIAPLAGAKRLEDDVIGELGWYVYFTLWAPAARVPASEGWGGDRVWVGRRKGRVVSAIATAWDSGTDADEFVTAYELSVVARFPGITKGDDGGYAKPGGGTIYVFKSELRVFVVDGTAADADTVFKSATFE